ncbi:uncharacterized protein [Miscanthus floridulus]|uniref:uncharacterized protein n=1 Tax=Miscanthus floridulus TaxID=154761 RepID=UPI00345B2375
MRASPARLRASPARMRAARLRTARMRRRGCSRGCGPPRRRRTRARGLPGSFPAPPPLPFHAAPPPDSALAAALVTARAAAAEGQARLRAAVQAWERERDAADVLARQIAEAEQLLVHPLYHDTTATSSASRPSPTVVLWPNSADPLVAQLHYQAGGVQNIRSLVPVVLDPESPSYARWRDLVLLILRRYALDDHVLTDALPAARTPSWLRLDSIVLSWILGTISLDLHDLVRSTPESTARRAWLALEGQFLGNAEARALRLDASFRTFVQGDLSVGEYCRKMKTMADSLGDLGWAVEDRILVLNVLRGLNERYSHLRTWITRQWPFPTFLQVRDDLVMEELTQGITPGSLPAPGSSSSSTALAATPPPRPSAPPASSLLGPPPGPSGGGGGPWRPSSTRGGGVVRALAVGVLRRLHGVHPGPPSTTLGQGASPCGPSGLPGASLVHRRPCSLAPSQSPRSRRRGLHLPGPRQGLSVGTRRLWPALSAP